MTPSVQQSTLGVISWYYYIMSRRLKVLTKVINFEACISSFAQIKSKYTDYNPNIHANSTLRSHEFPHPLSNPRIIINFTNPLNGPHSDPIEFSSYLHILLL